MNTAKIFKSGNSQAVRLPREFNLQGEEVIIKKIGTMVLLIPKEDPWAILEQSLGMFTPEYMETREQPPLDKRETF